MYQNVPEGKLMFSHKSVEFCYLVPGLYPSITDIVQARNTLIQEKHNQSESCITVKVPQITQNVESYLANETSGLAFLSTDLGHFFRSNVGNEIGVMFR